MIRIIKSRLIFAVLFICTLCNVARADTVTFFHNDVSGTPIAASDESGNLLWKENYKPYGEKLEHDPLSSSNKIGFHGKAFDDTTGLSYMGARYYDPSLGRFMGMDPVDFQASNLHSFNRYAYSNNNPYKYVDPDGEFAVLAVPAYYALLALATVATVNSVMTGNGQSGASGFDSGTISYPGSDIGSPSKWNTVNNNSEQPKNEKDTTKDTLKPGEFAGDSIPARGPGRDFSQEERDAVNEIGRDTGCHTCGSKEPGTKSKNHIPDHQPANALNPSGGEQRLYPHCLTCSRIQGGQVRGAARRYNQ